MFSRINPDFNQSLLEFIHILERCLIDPLLHDPPELVIDQIEVQTGSKVSCCRQDPKFTRIALILKYLHRLKLSKRIECMILYSQNILNTESQY